jgi:hypothetical protein
MEYPQHIFRHIQSYNDYKISTILKQLQKPLYPQIIIYHKDTIQVLQHFRYIALFQLSIKQLDIQLKHLLVNSNLNTKVYWKHHTCLVYLDMFHLFFKIPFKYIESVNHKPICCLTFWSIIRLFS